MIFYLYIFILAFAIGPGSADPFCDFYEEHAQGNPNISAPCLKQIHTVCNNSDIQFKMFDASSKFLIPGMSYSNVIDYGNFPECLSIKYEDEDGIILGKFCALSVIIVNVFLSSDTIEVLDRFGIDSSYKTVTITMDTFNKMQPHFRDILYPEIPFVFSKYSTCIPDACTSPEMGAFYLLSNGIPIGNETIQLFIFLDILDCETVDSNTNYEWGDILFIVFLCLLLLVMIASTIYDALCQNFQVKPHHPLFIAFSILYNGKKLLAISNDSKEQIQCFNGMRFISMMWVVAYHGTVPIQAGVITLENYPEVQSWSAQWTSQYILSALLAVDTFFFIAGFLLAFTYLKSSLGKDPIKQLINVPKMYLHRYLRLTPSVAAMYLVMITIFRFLGSGPAWSIIAKEMKESCTSRWWQFFLYIQNYTDPDTMCVNPMWYLSADMQMFILAPIVLIPTATYIKRYYRQTLAFLAGLTILTIIIPIVIRYGQGEVGNTYGSHERFNNFLIGFTFGAIMRLKKNQKFIFNAWTNLILWIIVLTVGVAFNVYWHYAVYTEFDLLKYTLFIGFYRPVWCLSLCFMVYSCYHNQGGIIQWFLSRPGFQILGKLSYSMYVLHVSVLIYAVGTLRTTVYFSNYFLFYNWCGHIIVTMIFSVIWVLAFEYPMLTIDKYLLG